jgi:hypothetical protein
MQALARKQHRSINAPQYPCRTKPIAGTYHTEIAGGVAAYSSQRALYFQTDGKVIDLDAIVAALELG